jgi:hypothetical protein
MKNRFQSSPFKCNLQRYILEGALVDQMDEIEYLKQEKITARHSLAGGRRGSNRGSARNSSSGAAPLRSSAVDAVGLYKLKSVDP